MEIEPFKSDWFTVDAIVLVDILSVLFVLFANFGFAAMLVNEESDLGRPVPLNYTCKVSPERRSKSCRTVPTKGSTKAAPSLQN